MDPVKEAALTASIENALQATQAYKTFMDEVKTDLKTMKPKLDGFDQNKITQLADDITKAGEAQQKANAAHEARAKVLEDEIKALVKAAARPGAASIGTLMEQKEERKQKLNKHFNAFAKTKDLYSKTGFDEYLAKNVTDPEELKALSVGTDPNGGYTVLPEMGGVITTYIFESSPIRQLASVIAIGSDTYEDVIDNDETAANWVGEATSRAETTTPVLGKLQINVNEIEAMPKATQKLLDDSFIDIESWLANKVAAKFLRFEASGFVTGNGVNKPKGIMSYPNGTTVASQQVQQIGTGDAANFTYDGLVNLQSALKENYQPNATFLLQRASIANIMQIKDSYGHPIFNSMFDKNVGLEPTIMGRPVRFAADIAAVGNGNLAAAYGDFREAYLIVDRTGIRILRDPFTAKPYVLFYTTKRVGGGVKNFEAYVIQSIG